MHDDSFKERYLYAPMLISETDTYIKTNHYIHNEIEVHYVIEEASYIGTKDSNTYIKGNSYYIFSHSEEYYIKVSDGVGSIEDSDE